MNFRRNLLWIDCSAGFFAGAAMLLLHQWLGNFYEMPPSVFFYMGMANLAYATYSFSLAVRSVRTLFQIRLLAVANMIWALICLFLLFAFVGQANFFGIGHLAIEALIVGGMGVLEWRWQTILQTG